MVETSPPQVQTAAPADTPIDAALVDEILTVMDQDFPDYKPGTRPAHTKGIAAIGHFTGLPDASRFTKAPQFGAEWTPVTVRFSNSNGQLDPDWEPQVRGLAIRFHVGGDFKTKDDGSIDWATPEIVAKPGTEMRYADLVCMSAPLFPVDKATDMPSFGRALIPKPVRFHPWYVRLHAWLRLSPLPPQGPKPPWYQRVWARLPFTKPGNYPSNPDQGVLDWTGDHPKGLAFAMALGQIKQSTQPASYLRTTYYGVHAFELENAAGVKRMGRFTLESAIGVRRLAGAKPVDVDGNPVDDPDDYLQQDLRDRLANDGSARFNLQVQLADPGDPTDDPTVLWPSNRQYLRLGTLELHTVIDGADEMAFNPGRLVEGVAVSDDQILHTRMAVYEESQRRRGVAACPLGFTA